MLNAKSFLAACCKSNAEHTGTARNSAIKKKEANGEEGSAETFSLASEHEEISVEHQKRADTTITAEIMNEEIGATTAVNLL